MPRCGASKAHHAIFSAPASHFIPYPAALLHAAHAPLAVAQPPSADVMLLLEMSATVKMTTPASAMKMPDDR